MVLPSELVAFVVAPQRLGVSRAPITASSLDALAAPQDDAADRALYDLLIRPSEASLNVARKLIVVADPSLQQVCFAALLDSTTNRRLIERMPVAMAPNAGSLKLDELAVPASVLAIALPSGERTGTAALPEGAAELADIRGVYAKAVEIDADRATVSAFTAAAPAAAVIHITGHTERQPGLGDAALLFRGAGAAVEPVTWSRIAELNLGQPVVVLAACETLRVPPSPQAHTLSLAAGFIAAGARAVIGTLTPVSDNESRLLFGLVHRRLARGESPATALQQTQLEAIAAGHPGWRSVAVITNRI
jgi:CHAT domain-containing protein